MSRSDKRREANSSMSTHLDEIVAEQLTSLDDADAYASAWATALEAIEKNEQGSSSQHTVLWGGRGKGGRGLGRQTYQPHQVIVDGVSLEYVGSSGTNLLLDHSTTKLKLLSSRVYAMIGRNGCGKSSLLRRMDAGTIPGFPPHLSTMYIAQEVLHVLDDNKGETVPVTPLGWMLGRYAEYDSMNAECKRLQIEQLEAELESLNDPSAPEYESRMEELCEQISAADEELELLTSSKSDNDGTLPGATREMEETRQQAIEALDFFGVNELLRDTPLKQLSGGIRKKVALACALFCSPDILMLDEPTNFLDILGIVQLRRLIVSCQERNAIVVLVSHDADLINDMATDVIHFANETLTYYPDSNYRGFLRAKLQRDLHHGRQAAALDKQRDKMKVTIKNLQRKAAKGDGKKSKAVESRKKKLERHGIEKDEHGHRWTAQNTGSGIRQGSINSVDATTRNKFTNTQLLKRDETNIAPIPDKAVQFDFRDTTCTWGEPLIMAMDVGHGYGPFNADDSDTQKYGLLKRKGMLFDCVELCIEEGSRTCILGKNGSGKSSLLRILAKLEQPREGTVHHALNVHVEYFHQHIADEILGSSGTVTALSMLTELFPLKTEQELRGELTAFGLSPQQATGTQLKYLSGGERCRLCLAILVLRGPDVLLLDEITNHLDVESVDALTYGMQKWNGTIVLVSHDANLIRNIGGACFVLMEEEGKLRYIPNGIDSYLKAFTL